MLYFFYNVMERGVAMNILYYNWTEYAGEDLMKSFSNLGFAYTKIMYPITDYNRDPKFDDFIDSVIKDGNFDVIFTFDFFPLISKAAQRNGLPYIAWIFDSPHYTLFSDTLFNNCNRVFFFDKDELNFFTSRGLKNGFYAPLPVNVDRLDALLGDSITSASYDYSISFIGQLYSGNMYDRVNYLPPYIKGFLDGIIAAQGNVYGYNFVSELLTNDWISKISEYIKLTPDEDSPLPLNNVFSNMINAKITHLDRCNSLNLLSNYHTVDLFTKDELSPDSIPENLHVHGPVSYTDEMPYIFRHSKINLNISLRSITSGIPLRAMDIMGAGGFLLSNFQNELSEYFEVNKELALYDSRTSLAELADYYINHDEERCMIAERGYKKIKENFTHDILIPEVLRLSGVM